MKKLYVRYVSYMCIFAMMFLSVAPLLSVTLVSAEQINDSATTEAHLFESSDFNLVLDKEKLKSDDDQIWEIKISSVSSKLEGLAIRIKNEQQTWLTEVKRDQQILQSNAKGLFILTPEETRLTFNANENTHIIVDIFKIVDGNESFLGTVKHEEDAEQVDNTDETETPLEDGESSEELETSETDELHEESNTSEENNSYTTSMGEEKSHVIDRTTETNVNVKSPNGNTGNPNVPKGAIELGDIFGGLNIKGGAGNSNSGVVNITDPNENNGVPYSEIRLSGQNNWLSIWSKNRYKMDFSKSFQGRTYINFGTKDADGLAFVIQNEGSKALTTANTDKDGQNLGVYGSSKKGFWEWTPNPAENAIKNSVAIEFDLHLNNSGDTLFDKDIRTNPHMAYTFPGNKNGGITMKKIISGLLVSGIFLGVATSGLAEESEPSLKVTKEGKTTLEIVDFTTNPETGLPTDPGAFTLDEVPNIDFGKHSLANLQSGENTFDGDYRGNLQVTDTRPTQEGKDDALNQINSLSPNEHVSPEDISAAKEKWENAVVASNWSIKAKAENLTDNMSSLKIGATEILTNEATILGTETPKFIGTHTYGLDSATLTLANNNVKVGKYEGTINYTATNSL